jgi:hypothetical protein
MTEPEPGQESAPASPPVPSIPPIEEPSERGTAVLALLFIAAMAGMWSVVYFIMIERGG